MVLLRPLVAAEASNTCGEIEMLQLTRVAIDPSLPNVDRNCTQADKFLADRKWWR
jgi:hypothetical protein